MLAQKDIDDLEKVVRAADFLSSSALEQISAFDILSKYSARPEDFLSSCTVNITSYRVIDPTIDAFTDQIPCSHLAPVIESVFYGRKCFTFFSKLRY